MSNQNPENEMSKEEFYDLVEQASGTEDLEKVLFFENDPEKVSVAAFWLGYYLIEKVSYSEN